ncbi:response regulator [Paenibacillus sp. NPDC055715]
MATIIIVDDSLFMRSVLKDIFLDLGHSVIAEAENGYDAVLKYSNLRPDLITMDINMPKMDGLEAVGKIIGLDPEAKILMCSALGQQEAIIKAFQAGAKDFIVKPFEMERVVNAITKIFGS